MAEAATGSIDAEHSPPLDVAGVLDEVAVPLVVLDRDRRILLANRAFELLTGCDKSDVVGVPCRDVLRFNSCLRDCPAVKAGECGARATADGDIITRDHARIPVRVTAGALMDDGGALAGFVETIEDIRDLRQSRTDLRALDGLPDVIGMSPRMQELLRLVPVVAQADSSVLLTGETGTGKDVFAEMIHRASGRADHAFVKINCGALPENLLESELFGHKRGAFTGAVSDKMGRLRMADEGTVYLTEIGDLPLPLQVKLLTYLDDRIVHPLGSTSGITTDVRVIAATHRDLERMVREGEFREDLFFRLNVVRLSVPPLRDRDGDVQLLLEHYRALFASRFGKRIDSFSTHARQLLLGYPYPGNVRELRNIVEYATGVCTGDTITVEHLPRYLLSEEAERAGRPDDDARSVRTTTPVGSGDGGDSSWAAVERQLILDALTRSRGRRGKAAELLGWARTTLWRKMKEHDL
jgi:PAS domain S-box-containing protein